MKFTLALNVLSGTGVLLVPLWPPLFDKSILVSNMGKRKIIPRKVNIGCLLNTPLKSVWQNGHFLAFSDISLSQFLHLLVSSFFSIIHITPFLS